MDLSGWTKYSKITTPAMTKAQTDLNYRITITYESWMQADFDDIRFIDSDESTLLDQCRESYSSGVSAVWWVQVPVCPAAGKTIYVYAGNDNASLESDGDDTFGVFDNYTGNDTDPPDAAKWVHSSGVDIFSNSLRVTNRQGWCTSNNVSMGLYYGVKCKAKNGIATKQPLRELGFHIQNTNQFARHIAFYTPNGGTFQNGYGASLAAPDWDLNTWHEIEIRRESGTITRCKYDDVDYVVDGSGNPDTGTSSGIGVRLWTTYFPSVAFYVDYIFSFKLPDDGTEIEDLTLDGWVSVGEQTWREHIMAFQNDVTTWGTPVSPSTTDKILIEEIDQLMENADFKPDPSFGFAWHEYIYKTFINTKPVIKIPLRYSGRIWSFIAQSIGADSVAGSDPYVHTMSPADQIDGSDLWGTMAFLLGRNTTQLVFEWPSIKVIGFSISGPHKNSYLALEVRTVADCVKIGSDANIERGNFGVVSHIELDSALPKIIPFGACRLRINDQSGGALGSGDTLKVNSINFNFNRKISTERNTRASYAGAWKSDEPKESGIPEVVLSFKVGNLDNLTHLENFQDETSKKCELLWAYDANYNFLMRFPSLKPISADPRMNSVLRLGHTLSYMSKKTSSAPSGMSVTNWQFVLTDGHGTSYV